MNSRASLGPAIARKMTEHLEGFLARSYWSRWMHDGLIFFFSRVWPVLVVACGCENMSHLWPHVGRAAAIRGRLLIEQRKRSSGAGDGPDLARMTINRRLSDCCETQTMGVGRRWQG
ncbi:tRNA (mo5U34)-methyltransferase [Striga asiatica]|uniref:tRNA (Mo5U34)-methyltransferase n=1 Tax=Striga asiatica TaxID=4170 RepID=A0A5A7PD55_STRAF|nr:tRNA (mo5U34)-methyltransferase [Striga asiatica]